MRATRHIMHVQSGYGTNRRSVCAAISIIVAGFVTLAVCGCSAGVVGTSGSDESVQVSLTWSEAVDLDLEVWNSIGSTCLVRAYAVACDDIQDGTRGSEMLAFASYEQLDLSSGTFTVSVLFAGAPESVRDATATVTVSTSDGESQMFSRRLNWGSVDSQWHVCRVNVTEGIVREIDRMVRVESIESSTLPEGAVSP